MDKLEATVHRYQGFLGVLLGTVLFCAAWFGLPGHATPAQAAPTDVQGPPQVAVDYFLGKDSSGKTFVKIVWADGHVSDPINPAPITSGTLSVTNLVQSQ